MLKLAIYDIDYTVISVNSLLIFYYHIFKKYPKKFFYLPYLFITFCLWIIKLIRTKKVKELWLKPLLNINKDELDQICRDFIKKSIIPKIKTGAIDNINNYKKKGYKIVFASASYEIYIKYIAEYLNADYFFGTKIAFNGGKITSKIDGSNCRGDEKIRRITELIPLNDIDVNASASFSDSDSDKPFLKISKRLYKIRHKKWVIKSIITE